MNTQFFLNFKKHPLISGSFVVFTGSFFINGFNYLFNLIMGRMLPIADYGLLVALVALVTVITIFQTAFSNLFARLSARYTAQKRDDLKGSLFYKGTKITFMLGVIVFILLLTLTFPIANFLHTNNFILVFLVFFCIVISIFTSLPMGILQGELKFFQISIANILGIASKISLGILLVVLSFGVQGAMIGVMLAYLIPYLITLFFNRRRKKSTTSSHMDFYSEFKKVSAPFILASIGIIIFQSTDVIFARHFLSGDSSGQFAALSLMGKAIFYITSPLYFVFLPVITHKRESGQSTRNTLLMAIGIILMGNLFFCLVYVFFPQLILSVFFPQREYLLLGSFLGLYSIYILIFSIAFLIHTYFLSVGKTGIYKPSIIAALTYIVLLLFYHNSIREIVYVLISSSFLLLILLLVYYWLYERD